MFNFTYGSSCLSTYYPAGVLELSTIQLMQQWQVTLFIFNLIGIVLSCILELNITDLFDNILPLIYTLGSILLLYIFCKVYLDDYVKLSKI